MQGALCSALLAVEGGDRARDRRHACHHIYGVKTIPFRSEAGVGPAGSTPSRAASAGASAALEDQALPVIA
eukprot:5520324-Pleurochrysis_carterae.AAC.2